MQPPETEFAHCGDIQIAYQLFGSGPAELVVCGGPAGHIDLWWEHPLAHQWHERMASFARVVVFDRRGTGASDHGPIAPSDEQYMEDLLAVLDACGLERPALLGVAEGARMCAMFAARHPERISALILVEMAAVGSEVLLDDKVQWLLDVIEERWGKGELAELYAPSRIDDQEFRRWAGRLERNAVSPRCARQILGLALQSDVTEVLPQIRCPTLVIHRRDNRLIPVELGRRAAAAIPDARFVEVAGEDTFIWLGDAEAIAGEIEEFLTGKRSPTATGRKLAAVLFTDIVGSTELAARLSDRRWRQLLDEHDRRLHREIDLNGGNVIKDVGDGFLAVFDTPVQAVSAAKAAIDATRSLSIDVRAGSHVGAIDQVGDDVQGIAVHIAARICELARPGQVLVSNTVQQVMLDSPLALREVGRQVLRGVPGEWCLYELDAGGESSPRSGLPVQDQRASTSNSRQPSADRARGLRGKSKIRGRGASKGRTHHKARARWSEMRGRLKGASARFAEILHCRWRPRYGSSEAPSR